ncbi:amino acid ABC transporter permease [Clostridioides sp. ES-S-0108-01]|uniref:amino acid ABC transporter permease n=1 Tax=Clostridioides sp. ES-S-0108-01 TaxID=2770773 RepID=UPI001D0C8DDE|nr:amino acid ABC transporter permease [Clostridioides sp. ES-S-0108-01]UDN49859.1 amino acid ABC transporter permease [Clostridioides sp. ES-S-0107-01]
MSNFNFEFCLSIFPFLIKALGVTILISIVAFFISILLGAILAFFTQTKSKVLKYITRVYISFFRGTPLLIQIFFFYFGFPMVFSFMKDCSPYLAIVICLGLNSSAYMAEIIRASIESVDKGQQEACYAFGLSKYQSMVKIILPQAAISAVPPIVSCILDIIKGSSLGLTIGIQDLMGVAQVEAASSFKYFEIYMVTILIYWGVSVVLSNIQSKVEKRIGKAY